jgi:hypothetical protein
MPFHGHGSILDQDIFVENGRRAWAVEELLGVQLHAFSEGLEGEDLEIAAKETRRIVADWRSGQERKK